MTGDLLRVCFLHDRQAILFSLLRIKSQPYGLVLTLKGDAQKEKIQMTSTQ